MSRSTRDSEPISLQESIPKGRVLDNGHFDADITEQLEGNYLSRVLHPMVTLEAIIRKSAEMSEASLLIGGYAAIDEPDGAGMNLMDIKKRCWSKAALEAITTCLEGKLGKLAPAYATAGSISQYIVQRFGFEKNCVVVVQWSGDNPNSLAGLSLSIPGDLAISLGTSDTARLLILVQHFS